MGCFGSKDPSPTPDSPPQPEKGTPQTQARTYTLHILLVGDLGTGKTSVIRRYVMGKYIDNSDDQDISAQVPSKTVSFGDCSLALNFFDTAKQEKFKNVTMTFYQNSQAILACYDINDKGSFEGMKTWLKEAKKFSEGNSVVVCVGTKNDMSSSRAVKYTEASEFAESEKVPYFECTSKDGNSVDELFRSVGEQLVKRIKDGLLDVSE